MPSRREDLDGDGLDELAIGAPYQWIENANRGAVWIVKGQDLLEAPLSTIGAVEDVQPMVLADMEGAQMIAGIGASAESGRGIAIAGGHVFVGAVSDTVGEDTGLGTLRIYGTDPDGSVHRGASAIFVGETFRPGAGSVRSWTFRLIADD